MQHALGSKLLIDWRVAGIEWDYIMYGGFVHPFPRDPSHQHHQQYILVHIVSYQLIILTYFVVMQCNDWYIIINHNTDKPSFATWKQVPGLPGFQGSVPIFRPAKDWHKLSYMSSTLLIRLADKITYYSQWTWPKWAVPYRLWRFVLPCYVQRVDTGKSFFEHWKKN